MFNLALHAARKTPVDIIAENFTLLALALLSFGAFIFLIFLIASRTSVKTQEWLKYLVFLVPSILLLVVGLIYPAIRTLILSFMDKEAEQFVGFDNYVWAFTIPEITVVLTNTAIWVVTAPILSTVIGLSIAYMTDRMKRPAAIKSLIFMPMAISFVGAGVIWKFVYNYQPREGQPEIGLLSAIFKAIGLTPPNWMLEAPLNTFLLIVVMIWIQTGFAMVVLSAALKNVPDEVVEAAMLDGATPWKRFYLVSVPMIRATIVVVLTTITIGTLKVFDIVRTMTGGNFHTNVLGVNFMLEYFVFNRTGRASAVVVLLMLAIIPIMIYQVRTYRKQEELR